MGKDGNERKETNYGNSVKLIRRIYEINLPLSKKKFIRKKYYGHNNLVNEQKAFSFNGCFRAHRVHLKNGENEQSKDFTDQASNDRIGN